MAELLIPMGRLAARQHLSDLTPSKAEGIENPSHDTRADGDRLLVETVGNLLRSQIGPHDVGSHRITGRPMVDRPLHILDQVRLVGFGFLAAATRLADPRSGRILGQLLELSHAVSDGLRITPQDAGHVLDASMAEFDRFHGGKAAAVLFRQAPMILAHEFFDLRLVGFLKRKGHDSSSSRSSLSE